jgi:hypothetical protein
MRFAINEDILKKAVKCRSNYSCLSGGNDCLCEIEDYAGENIHFINPLSATHICNYKMGFGFSYVCNCFNYKKIKRVNRNVRQKKK